MWTPKPTRKSPPAPTTTSLESRSRKSRACIARGQAEAHPPARSANAYWLAAHAGEALCRCRAQGGPLAAKLKTKHNIEFLSIGGGIGIIYEDALASGQATWWERKENRDLLTPEKYADTLVPLLQPLGLKVLLEPGRFISGNAGILVSRVEYVKRTGKKYLPLWMLP